MRFWRSYGKGPLAPMWGSSRTYGDVEILGSESALGEMTSVFCFCYMFFCNLFALPLEIKSPSRLHLKCPTNTIDLCSKIPVYIRNRTIYRFIIDHREFFTASEMLPDWSTKRFRPYIHALADPAYPKGLRPKGPARRGDPQAGRRISAPRPQRTDLLRTP
ncbi:hypothetical protein AVEN_221006-1 [Araneus ventricosus]|uniref:Uncharacterized protein n=1 Tax=Araneus ventricosus TaxID=182803 RepID=A0A4Y2ER80_ARAVE|nr:hypothetical protein AVEN_221006-1 [Araneus ventricosus]